MSTQRAAAAALELESRLTAIGLPFCFIGGIAVQRWGEPRMMDAHATVVTEFIRDEQLVDALLAVFRPRFANARSFALKNRVLLLQATDGTHLDVALGALPFELRCVQRSSVWRSGPDISLRTCGAEDLVVFKSFAARERDWLDIDGILVRQGRKLDARLILRELSPLVEVKEDSMIIPRLTSIMQKRGIAF